MNLCPEAQIERDLDYVVTHQQIGVDIGMTAKPASFFDV